MVEVPFWLKFQRIEKAEIFSQGTEDCQNLKYEKSDYC